MIGIKAMGTHVPMWRLGPGTKGWRGQAERAVAGFDEDSITMAVGAVIDCLGALDRTGIDALYFATTTSPYLEKQGASIIATAANLRRDIATADFTDSLRAGTAALRAAADAVKAGSARQVLVVAADQRKAPPRSDLEATLGDGAAALLVSDSETFATIEDSYAITHEIHDIWRMENETTLHSWEDRFVFDEVYLKALPQAILPLLTKHKLSPSDLAGAACYAPDIRRHSEMTRILGLKPEQVQDNSLFNSTGNCGAAFALIMFINALEAANPGEKVLLANYGNGADAFLITLTDKAKKSGLAQQIAAKRLLDDYLKYAQWRGFIEFVPAQRRPTPLPPAASALFREQAQNLGFQGSKCRSCHYEQFPPQRVCTKCHTKDSFDLVSFAGKPGTLFSYSVDYITPSLNPPTTFCMVNFNGGGRAILEMTDYDASELKVDIPLEMTFRRLHTAGAIHNYFWKCSPVRRKESVD